MRSLQFTCLNAITFAEIAKDEMSAASSMQSMGQRLAQSMGVALGAYALELSSRIQGHDQIVASDFWPAFLLIGAVAASSAFSVREMPPDAGAELSGRVQTREEPAAE